MTRFSISTHRGPIDIIECFIENDQLNIIAGAERFATVAADNETGLDNDADLLIDDCIVRCQKSWLNCTTKL